MKTTLLEPHEFRMAVEFLAKNQLVVIPTETVYGVGANACSDVACSMIYRVKNRPIDNPIIVHCADLEMAQLCMATTNQTELALSILSACAPAPLTVIAPASEYVCATTKAGGDTVALRIPQHNLCRDIIAALGKPIAAPSANMSGRPSATSALMAWEAMSGKVAAIVDGGVCHLGLESTIVDCTTSIPLVVREGSFSRQGIEQATGLKLLQYNEHIPRPSDAILQKQATRKNVQTIPGSKYTHYTPKSQVCCLNYEHELKFFVSVLERTNSTPVSQITETDNPFYGLVSIGFVGFSFSFDTPHCKLNRRVHSWEQFAPMLYEIFAEIDRLALKYLFMLYPPKKEYPALYDRMSRASQNTSVIFQEIK